MAGLASALLSPLRYRAPTEAARPLGRFAAIDAGRGAALAAMAAYHATWDLGFLQLTPENYALTPAGRVAAHGIAGTFLTLVGVGLVLMTRHAVSLAPFLRRIARIGGAALLITLATRFAFPESYIFFGVLHCIAVSSVLALPFLFAPPLVTALVAAAVIAAPHLIPQAPFEASGLLFLGLGGRTPDTNDYVPLFPWFGVVLGGVVLARLAVPALTGSRIGAWEPRWGVGRLAVLAGRHSLAIYLVHQPVLLAVLFGLVSLTGPHPRVGLASFRAEYEANCARSGGSAEACRIAGRCTAHALRRDGLWGLGIAYTAEQRARARGLSQGCYEAAEGTAPPP